jgi:hypothetical protein
MLNLPARKTVDARLSQRRYSMYCKIERSRIGGLIGALMVAIFAVITPRTGAAQQVAQQDSAPLTLLVVIFPDTAAAQAAMTSLSQTSTAKPAADKQSPPPNTAGRPVDVQWVEPYYAMASKDKSGKVQVQQHGKKGDTPRDQQSAHTIDGIAALLGERPSETGQAGAGATRAGISSADAREMQNAFGPGETALIIVVDQPAVPGVTSSLKEAGATEVYDAPLVAVAAE